MLELAATADSARSVCAFALAGLFRDVEHRPSFDRGTRARMRGPGQRHVTHHRDELRHVERFPDDGVDLMRGQIRTLRVIKGGDDEMTEGGALCTLRNLSRNSKPLTCGIMRSRTITAYSQLSVRRSADAPSSAEWTSKG